ASAKEVAEGRAPRWPGLRAFVVSDSIVTRVTGEPVPQESKLAGWVARLDSLPRHGIVELGRQRYLGAAAKREGMGLVALEPAQEAFDSTLSPLMGAEVRMAAARRTPSPLDSLRGGFEDLTDSLRALPIPEHVADSLVSVRAEHMARAIG